MRHIDKMDTSDKRTLGIALGWHADTLTIVNPTNESILVRQGGTDIPSSVDTADLFFPPKSTTVYPVKADIYGFGFSTPTVTDTSLTEDVIILLTHGEGTPAFGSMPIGSVTTPIENTQLDEVTLIANGFSDFDVSVATDVSMLALVTNAGAHLLLVVTGNDSGIQYRNEEFVAANGIIVIPVLSDVDTSFNININNYDQTNKYVVLAIVGNNLTNAVNIALDQSRPFYTVPWSGAHFHKKYSASFPKASGSEVWRFENPDSDAVVDHLYLYSVKTAAVGNIIIEVTVERGGANIMYLATLESSSASVTSLPLPCNYTLTAGDDLVAYIGNSNATTNYTARVTASIRAI